MDSGSGSLQSSSGGDDQEYDSHHQPQLFLPPPLFFNTNIPPPPPPSASSSSIPHHQQQLPFHLSHHNYQNLQVQPTTFYDFPSTFNLQPTNFNPDSSNSFLNLDGVRPNPTSLRSEPTDFKNPPTSEGSTQNQNRSTPPSGVLHPKVTTKKRTRASRRAPTTVLTTDTTNFRAMVQEFTGIPSPPFTAGGSSSYSRRFDLFGSVRTNSNSNSAASNLEGASGSGLYPGGSKVQLLSSLNSNNNVAVEDQNVSNLQQAQAGIFSFQSVSEGSHLEAPHIHGSTTTSQQQLLSAALQNDHESWRGNGGGTTAATAMAGTRSNNNGAANSNCKLNFTGSSSSNNLQRDKEILLGNIVNTTRGESTVDSWICPSD